MKKTYQLSVLLLSGYTLGLTYLWVLNSIIFEKPLTYIVWLLAIVLGGFLYKQGFQQWRHS